MELEIQLNQVLDLTHLACMRYVLGRFAGNLDEAHVEWLLAFLADEWAGGNELTNSIGLWAAKQGLSAIIFFSARALPPDVRSHIQRVTTSAGD